MGLNIVAHRRVSLKGFALGWDDCFVKIRAINERERREYQESLGDPESEGAEERAANLVQSLCLDVIESGRIINTAEDGTQEPYDFNKSDVPAVVDALSFAWQSEIVSVATGSDRLKAVTSSI